MDMREVAQAEDKVSVGVCAAVHDSDKPWDKRWTIRKFLDDKAYKENTPYEEVEFSGNTLLDEGVAELIDLLIGETATAFSNANSYVGVGDSNTAESAAHTGLQAATNKLYKTCDTGYPQRSGNRDIVAKATFGSGDANFDWNEFTVANGSSDTADNLNRKVSTQGTKASGQTWELTLTITING